MTQRFVRIEFTEPAEKPKQVFLIDWKVFSFPKKKLKRWLVAYLVGWKPDYVHGSICLHEGRVAFVADLFLKYNHGKKYQ